MGPNGARYWGRFGAAGLLLLDRGKGVLLQHRVQWSHFGGTWALPGGAIREGETAVDGALREANEEAGVPASAVRVLDSSVLDLGVWTYTTIIAETIESFDAIIGDAESEALAWVPVDEVDSLPLHPGFASSWPSLIPKLRL
jgi:8-oxo-dGTP diphosphatase